MILNISGRTDVVAFYTPWLKNRFKQGFVDVRNPYYEKQVSRIYFKDVDAIVFCTKNPLPIIDYLPNITIPIIFHITLTPYKKDLEPNVPSKGRIIDGIKKVSEIISKDKVYVRYDPIIINERYTVNYHIKAFDNMCRLLSGYTNHIIISFVDMYKNVYHNKEILNIKELTDADYELIGKSFSKSATKYGMTVQTCAEKRNLQEYGFIKRDCVDHTLIYQLTGKTNFPIWKERPCKCVSMVDIGYYNSCNHRCKYCYANYDEKKVKDNILKHDPNSTMLIGSLKDDDIIKERTK
jgi:DNA repair photolyase